MQDYLASTQSTMNPHPQGLRRMSLEMPEESDPSISGLPEKMDPFGIGPNRSLLNRNDK
jgi:hypothetical protein